jgi:hypothetical protein
MNTAEKITEAYFRHKRGCFTLSDRKVKRGNNRQLDLLAYRVTDKVAFHVEVGVTHRENWCPTMSELEFEFEKKFFGAPPERVGKSSGKTDFERGKSYYPQIEAAYAELGLDPASIKRVWVCWMVKDRDALVKSRTRHVLSKHLNREFEVEILSLRDLILPDLQKSIGTANYDDDILRTLGFIKQRSLQTPDA